MSTLAIILSGIGGLIYGSFLNVLLWRLPEDKGIGGRSHCRSCNHVLSWYDLVPIFSFLFLSGKCRYCHKPIHPRYPVVELVTAGVLVLFFYVQTPELGLEATVAIFGLLILTSLFFFDLFYFILPDVLIFPAIIVYGIYDFIRPEGFMQFGITALLAGAFFAILYAVSRGKKLGFGDVKIAILIGLMFGYPLGLLSLIFGIWTATLTAFVLLALKKVGLKDAIPLGSFLALSSIFFIIFKHEALAIAALFQ